MRKIIKNLIVMSMMFLLTGCTGEPLDVSELRENEEVISYFTERNVSITDIELEKRQTNKEDKEDIAYVYIKAENEEVVLEGVYIIESSYFDEGGWNVMNIYCDEGGTYKPTDTVIYDISKIINTNYTSVEDIIYASMEYDEEQNAYECDFYFTLCYEGQNAIISEYYCTALKFDIYEGKWENNGEIFFINGDYELFIEDGMFISENDSEYPIYYELIFTDVDAQLICHKWEENIAFDEEEGYISGYKEYNLGISNYRLEDGGIILDEFANIYSWDPSIKICADNIYVGFYSRWTGADVEYNTVLERVE